MQKRTEENMLSTLNEALTEPLVFGGHRDEVDSVRDGWSSHVDTLYTSISRPFIAM